MCLTRSGLAPVSMPPLIGPFADEDSGGDETEALNFPDGREVFIDQLDGASHVPSISPSPSTEANRQRN